MGLLYIGLPNKRRVRNEKISKDQMKLGDLLYWPGHVAMYIGDDKYIHSTGASGGVVINSINPEHDEYRKT